MAQGLYIAFEFFVIFGVMAGALAFVAIKGQRDYAYLHPDDPFSKGVDAQWTDESPPPSEQAWREAGIRQTLGRATRRYGVSPERRKRLFAELDADIKAGDAIRAARDKDRYGEE